MIPLPPPQSGQTNHLSDMEWGDTFWQKSSDMSIEIVSLTPGICLLSTYIKHLRTKRNACLSRFHSGTVYSRYLILLFPLDSFTVQALLGRPLCMFRFDFSKQSFHLALIFVEKKIYDEALIFHKVVVALATRANQFQKTRMLSPAPKTRRIPSLRRSHHWMFRNLQIKSYNLPN